MSPPPSNPEIEEEMKCVVFGEMTTLLWFACIYNPADPITTIKEIYKENEEDEYGMGHTSSVCREVAHELIDMWGAVQDSRLFGDMLGHLLCNLSFTPRAGGQGEPIGEDVAKEIVPFLMNRIILYRNEPRLNCLVYDYDFSSDDL